MGSSTLQFHTVTDTDGFRALQAEWTALCAHARRLHLFDSYHWWLNAWLLYGSRRGHQLRLVVGRLDGRVVLVWPLVTDRRVLRMLQSGTLEYRDIVLEPSPSAGAWVEQAWDYVRSTVDADVYLMQNLRLPNAVASQLQCDPGARRVGGGWCSVIRLDRFADWDAYAARLPRKLLSDQRRQWKRIQRDMPGIAFRLVDRVEDTGPVMDWISEHKIAWAEARRKNPEWFAADNLWEGLRRAVILALGEGRLVMATLGDGERIVSAGWGFHGGDEYLFHAFAYDAAYATYSPSRLYLERLLQTCFERGVRTFDFMPGEEPYKRIWATDFVATESYLGPLNWRGATMLRLAKLNPMSGSFAETVRPLYRMLPKPIRRTLWKGLSEFQTVAEARHLKPPPQPRGEAANAEEASRGPE